MTTIGAPTHASVFNPTARVWSVDGILSTGSGSVARWQGLTFARTSGGVGTIGYGAAGDTQPSSRVGDAFSFFHPDRPNGNGNGLLELPVGYTSNSPIQGTLTFLGQTVSDLGVVDTDYTFPDGQVIRISSDYEAGPAVEITFTDDGTNTTASFSGSVDTTLLPAPNTTSVL